MLKFEIPRNLMESFRYLYIYILAYFMIFPTNIHPVVSCKETN